jgi:hypothetical protein
MTSGGSAPLAVTVQETQRLTGESRSTIYNHIANGDYKAKKSGARLLILYDSIKHRIEALPDAKIKPSRPRKASTHRTHRKRK